MKSVTACIVLLLFINTVEAITDCNFEVNTVGQPINKLVGYENTAEYLIAGEQATAFYWINTTGDLRNISDKNIGSNISIICNDEQGEIIPITQTKTKVDVTFFSEKNISELNWTIPFRVNQSAKKCWLKIEITGSNFGCEPASKENDCFSCAIQGLTGTNGEINAKPVLTYDQHVGRVQLEIMRKTYEEQTKSNNNSFWLQISMVIVTLFGAVAGTAVAQFFTQKWSRKKNKQDEEVRTFFEPMYNDVRNLVDSVKRFDPFSKSCPENFIPTDWNKWIEIRDALFFSVYEPGIRDTINDFYDCTYAYAKLLQNKEKNRKNIHRQRKKVLKKGQLILRLLKEKIVEIQKD
ncbi:MAG: hypothetical protein WC408_03455 [Candidatus Micrarchaeia archaeon]|jgi:hypothetical protein